MTFKMSIKWHWGDFPGDPVVENPPSNAGDEGLISHQGTEIPHPMGQLNLSAASTEATMRLNYRALVLRSPCAPTREAHAPTGEPTHAGTQHSRKENKKR